MRGVFVDKMSRNSPKYGINYPRILANRWIFCPPIFYAFCPCGKQCGRNVENSAALPEVHSDYTASPSSRAGGCCLYGVIWGHRCHHLLEAANQYELLPLRELFKKGQHLPGVLAETGGLLTCPGCRNFLWCVPADSQLSIGDNRLFLPGYPPSAWNFSCGREY